MVYQTKSIFVLLVLVTVSSSLTSPNTNEVAYQSNIETSLNEIVKTLAKISKSLNSQFPTTCDEPIGDLENIETDWNPNGIYSNGDEVFLVCKRGFLTPLLERKQTASCLFGNVWSIFQPCSVKTCSKSIGNFENAKSNWNSETAYFPTDRVTITCNEDYTTSLAMKEQQITCLPDFTWSTIKPCLVEECPSPFEKFEALCVYNSYGKRKWQEAKDYCEGLRPERGSSLLTFKESEQQKALVNYGKTLVKNFQVWISAHDQSSEGHYVWPDNEELVLPSDHLMWVKGQPNNMKGSSSYSYSDQDCLTITIGPSATEKPGIEDLWCTSEYYTICHIPV